MDVVTGRPPGREAALVLMYLAAAGVGGFQVLHPTQLIQAQGVLVLIWALMILVGGLTAAVGVIGRWWIPELVAQWLIGAPFIAWGHAVATASPSPARWAFVALCGYIIVGCVIRGVDIGWLARQQPQGGPR